MTKQKTPRKTPEFSTQLQQGKVPYFNFSKFSGSKLHISSTCAPLQPETRKGTGFFNYII